MSFTFENYKNAIKFTCKGNASRSEYWSFVGLSIIFAVVSAAICAGLGRIVPKIIEDFLGICLLIFIAFSAIVNFFVMVRRLHDAGKPGFLAPVFYVAAFMIRLMPQTSQAFDFLSAVYFAFWLFMMFMLCARTKEPTHLEKKSE